MNLTYLLIGGNVGNRLKNLETASMLIAENCGRILAASAVYETAAWGKTDQPAFLNKVLLVETLLDPKQLLQHILEIEKQMGRLREERYGPRIIDIDILFFNREIINDKDLTIPHPQFHLRRFALQPMQEIAANYIHPVFGKSIGQLLTECPDQLTVKKL